MGATQHHSPNDNQSADLAWLAFRYVAQELTAEEASAFELRLADDQAAREAVAQAVELSAAVKLVIGDAVELPTPLVCLVEARGFWSQKTWLQPAAWMAVGAAACLAAVVCLYRPSFDENQAAVAGVKGAGVKGAGEVEISPAGDLAMVWAESRHADSDDFDLAATGNGTDGHGMDSNGTDEHGEDAGDDSHVIAPGWLLAAVTRGEMTDDLHLSSDDE